MLHYRLCNLKLSYTLVSISMCIVLQVAMAAITAGAKGYIKQYNIVNSKHPDFSKSKLFSMAWTNAKTKTSDFFKNFKHNVRTIKNNKMASLKTAISNPRGTITTYVKSLTATRAFFNTVSVASSWMIIWMTTKNWGNIDNVSVLIITYNLLWNVRLRTIQSSMIDVLRSLIWEHKPRNWAWRVWDTWYLSFFIFLYL